MSTYPLLGKTGACNLQPANVLVDAFLPLVGSLPLPDNGTIYYKFDETEGLGYPPLGWARLEDDELITTLPYNYGPVLPESMADVVHSMATSHGDPRMPDRFLKVVMTVEMSPYPGGGGPQSWFTKDAQGNELPDYGLLANRVFKFTWEWDREKDPDGYVKFSARLESSSLDFWTREKEADGSWTEERTPAGDALYGESWGGLCSPGYLTLALQSGGTAEATYSSDYDWAELNVAFEVVNNGSYSFLLTVQKTFPHWAAPGATVDGEGNPASFSCHDEVAEILDDIDLNDLGESYDFHDSTGGVGTAKEVQLTSGNMYYIVPFWKKVNGVRTTERLFDCIRVPLANAAFPHGETVPGSCTSRPEQFYLDLWYPKGDVFQAVPAGLPEPGMLANLGVGWNESVGWHDDEYPFGGYLPGFDCNLLFKLQRRVRTHDTGLVVSPGWYMGRPDDLLASTVGRPTLHLSKCRVIEPDRLCSVTYKSLYGQSAATWPTVAEPGDGGVAPEDVKTVDRCDAGEEVGNRAFDWNDVVPTVGFADGGIMVLYRQRQVAVQLLEWSPQGGGSGYYVYAPGCFVDQGHWEECCTVEAPLESDRGTLSTDRRPL